MDHFLYSSFPVLANSTALWTTFGPVRAVNSAEMALYHLCVHRYLTEEGMQRYTQSQISGNMDTVSGLLFQNKQSTIKTFLLMHLDLLLKGRVNVLDLMWHIIEIFCFCRQNALKMGLPPIHSD